MMNQVSGGFGSALIILIVFIAIAYVLLIPLFVAAIANKQGRSGFLWFFLSILLNPFFSILILIALGDTDGKRKQKVIEDEQIRMSIRNSLRSDNNANNTRPESDHSRFMPH